ncbi:rapamycin-insensitive companion of mTOR-like isoform X2 [Mya arenaria]|uniref:rapamycin-insensitive companion of mTOR-like isoform X2 n=1 Tax=Mya arenaria TaxID=6604 RepID=UPI0022E4587D|nr:rapamycin-insensitive companion of mTOR-like isoform X2 [Mya arenaria]
MASAMARQQSGTRFRSSRFRGRHGSGEENVHLNPKKDPAENVKEVLTYAVKQSSYSKAKKLGYLNAFVRLIDKCGDNEKLGLPLHDIFICLSVNLIHAPKEVRAGTLRVIKHLITDETSLQVLTDLHLDVYMARALDICLENEVERIHAQKLVRKLVVTVASKVPRSLIHPLVAIGSDGNSERDRMVRASMACLCELTYSNPDLVAHCGGISMLLRKILDCPQYPRINESIVATILHLINYPATRHFVRFSTDLEQLIAPFTDCHFSYTGEATDQTKEDRESRFAASRMAIVTVMRSWPGIIRFCRPDGAGLQSLVGILYLPFQEIRQAVVELIFELFRLPLPDWTEDFTEALISIDPSKMRENWHLTEGFVANEGKSILPNTASIRPNLVDNHIALLLAAWIGAGVLDALVEVIITETNELFVRAVILLGELLYMANQLMPAECSNHSHYLPTLMALASSFDIDNSQRLQASIAVSYLERMHTLKKRGPIPCSLYLEQIVRQSLLFKDRSLSLNMQKNKLLDMHVRKRASSSEEICMQTLRDTQVLFTKVAKNWDWDLIEYVLKWPDEKLRKLEDQIYLRFLKRLFFYFSPTNHEFSRLEADHEMGSKIALVGCQLIDFIVKADQEEGVKLMREFLTDISLCLSEVALRRIAPESVLSPGNVINTLSHYYFLFVGRFSVNTRGDRHVEKAGIYQHFLDIISAAPQDSYVKLITSSLHYGREGNSRAVLTKALCAGPESGRMYATKLMRVLLRAKVQGFSLWGIESLVNQLYDQSLGVAMTSLSILEEACELKENLDAVIKLKPNFLHLGEKGQMILCRYMSTQSGFRFLTEANYTMNELKKWHTSFNTCYVRIVEELLNCALTTYEKTYQGSYTRRSSKKRQKRDVYLPFHLYGELVQHKEGFQLLRQQTYLEGYFDCIRTFEPQTESEVLQLKTALWAVGHISMSSWGVSWLQDEKIVPEIIRKAEESSVYSIRGTAFFVLGMISTTREGAEHLSQYGWESRWNTRAERWPLVEDHSSLLDESMDEMQSEMGFSMGASRLELGSPVSNLDFIAEEHFKLGATGRSLPNGDEDEDVDCDEDEQGLNMPLFRQTSLTYSPELRHKGVRLKHRTLPLPGKGNRSQTVPSRSLTIRSQAFSEGVSDRTRSVEHISAGRRDFKISSEQRSRSFNLDDKFRNYSKNSAKAVIDSDGNSYEHKNENNNINSQSDVISKSSTDKDSDETCKCDSDIETICVQSDCSLTSTSPNNAKDNPDNQSEQSLLTGSAQNQPSLKPTEQSDVLISVTDTDQVTKEQKDESDISESSKRKIHDDEAAFKADKSNNEDVAVNHEGTDVVQNDSSALIVEGNEGSSEKGLKATDSDEMFRRPLLKASKEEQSSSSESGRTTSSKSRADSFNTDTNTSGIGSYDSGHHGVMESHSLSPIASTNSLEIGEVQMRHKDRKDSRESNMHHSVMMRRMSNLTRVPSVRRQSSPGIGILPASKYFDFSENAIMYTTARDAMGYATLRNLMKSRQISLDMESDYGITNLYDSFGSSSSLNRTSSIDSTALQRPTSLMTYNLSGISLSEMDASGSYPPKARLYQQRPHTGQAEFRGLTLPVDIHMMFEASETDDKEGCILGENISRQVSFMQQSESGGSLFVDSTEGGKLPKSESGQDMGAVRQEIEARGSRSRATSNVDVTPQPLSSEHLVDYCVLCRGRRSNSNMHTTDEGDVGEVGGAGRGRGRSSSVNEALVDTSSSLNSTGSDSSASKMSYDTPMGRTLVRKEMLRFVINLSSSVGVKGAEQGLLALKQKFPKAFQDLCFYSDVSHLLGTCSFRLTARRFVQELFEELNITKLLDEACDILGIDDTAEKSVVDNTLPEQFDGFDDFS